MSAGTIHLTPWVAPDGQVQLVEDEVAEPLGIEIDGTWVHVCDYGDFGVPIRLRSYPASEVGQILWAADEPAAVLAVSPKEDSE